MARNTEQSQYENLLIGLMAYLSAIEGDEKRARPSLRQIADARDPATIT